MRVLSLALFISVCPHLCAAQNAFDLSSISDTKLRTCWEQLFTDIKQISEGKAKELYDLFFGKQYADLNSQQQNALDSVKMFLVDYTGYCLTNSNVVIYNLIRIAATLICQEDFPQEPIMLKLSAKRVAKFIQRKVL